MSYTLWRKAPNGSMYDFASSPTKEMALKLRDRLRATAKAEGKSVEYFVTHPDVIGPIEWTLEERAAP